jgi:uncharacterized protein (TIGR02246 family)
MLLLLLIPSCDRQETSKLTDRTMISKEIRVLTEEVIEAYEDLDPERILNYYDAGIVYTGNGVMTSGKHSFEQMLREVLASVRSFNYVEFERFEVQVLSDETAICAVQFREGITLEGGTELHIRLAISYIWKHLNGSWKIIHESSSFQTLRA